MTAVERGAASTPGQRQTAKSVPPREASRPPTPPAASTPEDAGGDVADVLAAHQLAILDGGCRCGWRWSGSVTRSGSDHRAHVAAALQPVLDAREHAAAEKAWDEGYSAGLFRPANLALGLGEPLNPFREARRAAPEDGAP